MLLNFHIKKGYHDLKFTRHIKNQKISRQICLDLSANIGNRTLIGFVKKSPAGPIKQLEREF